ncbi:hypothetical protein CspeluHIS016_0501620 [Cutaneotrichosporon spelunceum]|uniref:Phospholipase D1 n=1 Tax=Cutaneotrichosporon spelunceum TaxID=1672016 RepID=A0AAD3YCH8_9TREE|nr:hypothetical protein CspeluHIS016_0501620 [Cutaneotrichosporon spelunceum]
MLVEQGSSRPRPDNNPTAVDDTVDDVDVREVVDNVVNLNSDFKFSASKERSNVDEDASSTIPSTGLKKNLQPDGEQTNGNMPRTLTSDVSSLRSEDAVTAEDGGSVHNVVMGDERQKYFPRAADGNGYTTNDSTQLQGVHTGSYTPREQSLLIGTRGDVVDCATPNREQEGARGQGAGQHEELLSTSIVQGQSGAPEHQRRQEFADGEPKALMNTNVAPRDVANLPDVNAQDVPGPRNNIELSPRVVHLQFHNAQNDMGQRSKQGLAISPNGESEAVETARSPSPLTNADGQQRAPVNQAELDHEFAAHGFGRIPPGAVDTPSRKGTDQGWEDIDEPHEAGQWRTASGSGVGESSLAHDPKRSKKRHLGSATASRAAHTAAEPSSTTLTDKRSGGRKLRHQFRRGGGGRVHSKPAKVDVGAPSMTNEMLAGQLPVMILKTWMDRDDEGHRAVPVLLGNLRFRIVNSVNVPTGWRNSSKELFKIECEYGDGAIKWVVYRDLWDFFSLHTHYKTSNLGHRVTGSVKRSNVRHVDTPDFPRHALPYWARDKDALNKVSEKLHDMEKLVSHSDRENQSEQERQPDSEKQPSSQRRQVSVPVLRDLLQQYLIDLIRAVMFRPESTRLCTFFELSALTVALGPRGGFQGKAGFLKLPATRVSRKSNQPGLLPSNKWKVSRSPKWFIVRESYCVATNGPAETDIYDVFLIDTDFAIERPKRVYRKGMQMLRHKSRREAQDEDPDVHVDDEEGGLRNTSQHTFYISNAQRRLRLQAKSARAMHQFILSMERVATHCIWAGRNRFDSFAPIRVNVAAQWMVDGRDYFWNLSRAINMAKSRIYIHDWWISPEFYFRRPGDERYRLDNLLKRKAEEGVRIFIIIYNEVLSKATPVASQYVKQTLTGLHPNIMMQRSPSHLPNGTFYWSHHEKLCVIDETIAFMGGLDLCYGRWDTSQHILTDQDFTAESGPDGPVWRGKDYANERVAEFSDLEKPFEEIIDRHKTPRMPWHDVGLSLVGQPARDLCRHFIQRWNYLLRIKNHKRRMPFLLPPADFTERELQDLGLQGTCEVQICRSVGPWSMGTMTKIEHSVQNAYVKSIQLSEHFVYIENQYFVTSTIVDSTPIENRIGDALVKRIIRAHREGEKWRACVVIPLLPGYTHPVDAPMASSLRLILECQMRTICRGTQSIFSRLRKEGINPDDYINFFSLRGWGKFESGALATEQVYIHGKTMIVDDRLVLCGSANINERSQDGDRDSEIISVVRDTDMIDGTMGGKPFKVGRYAHTLRMRLMREHVGVDVDAIEEDELFMRKPLAEADDVALWDPDNEQDESKGRGISRIAKSTAGSRLKETVTSAVRGITKGVGENIRHDMKKKAVKMKHPRAAAKGELLKRAQNADGPGGGPIGDTSERQDVGLDGKVIQGFASSVVPTLEERSIAARYPTGQAGDAGPDNDRASADARAHPNDASAANEARRTGKNKDDVEEDDPIPYDGPVSQKDYEAVKIRRALRPYLNAKPDSGRWSMPTPAPKIDPNRFHDPLDDAFWNNMWVDVAVHNTQIFRKVFRCVPDDLATTWTQYKAYQNHEAKFKKTENVRADGSGLGREANGSAGQGGPDVGAAPDGMTESVLDRHITREGRDRKPSGENAAWEQWELDEMEVLLKETRGTLVVYPTRFLEAEDMANNFLFNQERILPLLIYN